MPADPVEIHDAEEEGVKFHYLCNPVRIIEKEGKVVGVECIRMELGEPDASGRRRPVPMKGSEFIVEVDTAIVAIGQTPNPLIRKATGGLETTSWGGIVTDKSTGATSVDGVFAGGDAVTGAATVITAMGAGKIAARGIDAYVRRKRALPDTGPPD